MSEHRLEGQRSEVSDPQGAMSARKTISSNQIIIIFPRISGFVNSRVCPWLLSCAIWFRNFLAFFPLVSSA